MKRVSAVFPLLVMVGAWACGGKTPSSPTAPSPTPSTLTVYASVAATVLVSSANADTLARAAFQGQGLDVGRAFLDLNGVRANNEEAAVLKFDLPSQVVGHSVSKATLELQPWAIRQDQQVTPTIRVSAITSDWNVNTLTWNIFTSLGIYTTGQALLAAPSSIALVDLDVTTIVQHWASGNWRNYGVELRADPYPDPGYPSFAFTGFNNPQPAKLVVELQ